MVRMCLHRFILIVLFLSLSCPAVVQAGDWVEKSDAPYAGGYGKDVFHMFNWSDKSDLSTHIVINEIEQNPAGFDEGNEWVELYNPTTSDVNLDGWRLSTTHGKTVTVTLYGTIPANGYFVYTHAEQWLDNEDESVTLRDPSLNEIDRTPYLTEPYLIDNGYYSWQRYPNGNDTDSDSDWMFRASTKGYGSCGELPPPKKIYVDDDFIDDPPNHRWNTIQEGINDASNGATIIVRDGIYRENVDVYKRLTIRSENGADATIVQAASVYDHVFEVTADWVNISGFTVTGATESWKAGVHLSYACYCNISNNNASNNDCGIYLSSSSNNTITNNSANSNNYGLFLAYSSNSNTLNSNTANSNNQYSIYLYGSSSNNTITGNTCSNNWYSIWLRESSNNTIIDNNASIYLSYSGGNTLTNNCGSIHLDSSSNNTIANNTLSNNSRGISLSCSSNNNTLTGNNASNNECGIYLSHSSGNTLTSNTADANSDDGIRVSGSGKNDYNNSIDTTNTVNGKPVYYFFNENGIVFDGLGAGHLTLAYCSDCTIKNSNVSSGDGIWLEHSSNNILTSNTANLNSGYGIYLSSSSSNTFTSNLMSDSRYNFGVSGWNDSYFDNNIDTTNLVDGKPVHYIKAVDGVTFDCKNHADAGTVYCIQCNNITIKDITLANNGAGVFFWKTNSSRIENVNAPNNGNGICLSRSSNNTIIDNNASNNQCGIHSYHLSNSTLVSNTCFSNRLGILLWGTSNSTLTVNTCSNNSGGIYMYSSSNNTLTGNICSNNDDSGIVLTGESGNNLLYHNNFIDNNGNAYDFPYSFCNITNFWNSSTDGNYYSDYAGCDNDTDGIGDTPHPIPSDSVDYFPLMQPWSEDTQQKGNLNGEGQITAADAVIVLQMAVSGERDDNVDMDGDRRVSSVDALMILQVAAGCTEIG